MKCYDLLALSTRVVSGVGWDRELETDIFRATEVNIRTVRPRYTFLTRSLDAVEDMRRRLLPQCPITVGTSADIGWEQPSMAIRFMRLLSHGLAWLCSCVPMPSQRSAGDVARSSNVCSTIRSPQRLICKVLCLWNL